MRGGYFGRCSATHPPHNSRNSRPRRRQEAPHWTTHEKTLAPLVEPHARGGACARGPAGHQDQSSVRRGAAPLAAPASSLCERNAPDGGFAAFVAYPTGGCPDFGNVDRFDPTLRTQTDV